MSLHEVSILNRNQLYNIKQKMNIEPERLEKSCLVCLQPHHSVTYNSNVAPGTVALYWLMSFSSLRTPFMLTTIGHMINLVSSSFPKGGHSTTLT